MGLSLALLEIYYPAIARALENRVDRFSRSWIIAPAFEEFSILEKVLFVPVLFVFDLIWYRAFTTYGWSGFIVLIALIIPAVLLVDHLSGKVRRWYGASIVSPLFTLALFTEIPGQVCAWLIELFNHVGKGHAIGGIGLALGVLGFTGEVYQVVMLELRSSTSATHIVEYWATVAAMVVGVIVMAYFARRILRSSDADSGNSNEE